MSFKGIIEDIEEKFCLLSNLINHYVIKLKDLIYWLLKLRLVIWIRKRVLIKCQSLKLCHNFIKMCEWSTVTRFRSFNGIESEDQKRVFPLKDFLYPQWAILWKYFQKGLQYIPCTCTLHDSLPLWQHKKDESTEIEIIIHIITNHS